MAENAELLHQVGLRLANSRDWPNWSADSEFRAARDRIRRRADRRAARAAPQLAEGRARLSETLEPALPDHLDQQADRLMHGCATASLRVATAESCTGGMLAALLTDIEGASHGFERGFVTYTEQSKAELLGIEPGPA